MNQDLKRQIKKGVLCPEHKQRMNKLRGCNVFKCPACGCWSIDYLKELEVLK